MFKKKNKYTVAVVGATGAVGREMVSILEERKFPVSELVLLASDRSEGEKIEFSGKIRSVGKLAKDSFKDVDIVLFSAGSDRSLKFAPIAVEAGAIVIDSSGAFRMDPKVPLVVPEINAHALEKHAGIIASPNCSSIGLLMALKPIHAAVKIKRIVVTTFQSVSGTGKDAIDELAGQTVALLNFKDIEKKIYPHQIAFNCLPHVDGFLENGYTREEMEMADGIRKVVEDESIQLTATAVRVPVFRSHAESVNIETERKISANEARAVLSKMPGVVVYDDPSRSLYPLQLDVTGKDETYIGRVREDETIKNGLNLWIVIDNIRKGAALNAVQIAEHLIS